MTAPDPGLTDLIAAHTLRVVELNEAVRYPECNGCDWVGGLVKDHAAHLASVVEQHTKGRMAALEVDSANWKGRYDATHEVLRACTETWTRTIRDRDHWQARAEKAEATIARVENALPEASTGFNPTLSEYDKGWERGQQSVAQYVRSAIAGDGPAALEGEQQ